jgi:hypothetical protein
VLRIVPERVATDFVVEILVGKYRVRQRRIAVDDLQPNAVPLLEAVSAGHDLDLIAIDLAGDDRLRINTGIERALFRAVFVILFAMRSAQPALGHNVKSRLQPFCPVFRRLRMLVGQLDNKIRVGPRRLRLYFQDNRPGDLKVFFERIGRKRHYAPRRVRPIPT